MADPELKKVNNMCDTVCGPICTENNAGIFWIANENSRHEPKG